MVINRNNVYNKSALPKKRLLMKMKYLHQYNKVTYLKPVRKCVRATTRYLLIVQKLPAAFLKTSREKDYGAFFMGNFS